MKCKECNKFLFDYIEKKLPLKEKQSVREHLQHCPKCERLFSGYSTVVKELHQVPYLHCPDSVVDRTFTSLGIRNQQKSFLTTIYKTIAGNLHLKISLAAVVTVIISSTLVFYPNQSNKETSQQIYSTEEVQNALNGIELALGYFNFYVIKSGKIVEEQVFSKSLLKPIETSMEKTVKPLLKGVHL